MSDGQIRSRVHIYVAFANVSNHATSAAAVEIDLFSLIYLPLIILEVMHTYCTCLSA
jgi:hypothetical protein